MFLIANLGGFLWLGSLIAIAAAFYNTQGEMGYKEVLLALISFPLSFLIGLPGLKPRVFFIPTWALSLIFISIIGWKWYAWYSLALDAAALYLIYWVLSRLVLKRDEREWARTQQEIQALKLGTFDNAMKLKVLATGFMTASSLQKQDAVLEHNRFILETVMSDYPEKLSAENVEIIKSHLSEIAAINEARDGDKKELKHADKVKAILDSCLKSVA